MDVAFRGVARDHHSIAQCLSEGRKGDHAPQRSVPHSNVSCVGWRDASGKGLVTNSVDDWWKNGQDGAESGVSRRNCATRVGRRVTSTNGRNWGGPPSGSGLWSASASGGARSRASTARQTLRRPEYPARLTLRMMQQAAPACWCWGAPATRAEGVRDRACAHARREIGFSTRSRPRSDAVEARRRLRTLHHPPPRGLRHTR